METAVSNTAEDADITFCMKNLRWQKIKEKSNIENLDKKIDEPLILIL